MQMSRKIHASRKNIENKKIAPPRTILNYVMVSMSNHHRFLAAPVGEVPVGAKGFDLPPLKGAGGERSETGGG